MAMATEQLFLPDDDATDALGARLAASLAPGDLVLLEGGLGAGKTALARAVIRALSGNETLEVPSPSFALVQPYEVRGMPLFHADLYRVRDPSEVDELGLFDQPDAIVLIEWPERASSLAGRATVTVRLSIPAGGQGRIAEIAR
jgi:tRNA threonylcarbamoyladenosine biosynthesis protein TsaE